MPDEVIVEGDDAPPEQTTVVVTTDNGSGEDGDLEIGRSLGRLEIEMAAMAGAITGIVERLDAIETRTTFTEATANAAVEIASEAAAEVEETQEEIQEDSEGDGETSDDSEESAAIHPDREHPLWRNPVKIRGRH